MFHTLRRRVGGFALALVALALVAVSLVVPPPKPAHASSASNSFSCQKVAYAPGALTANGTAGAQVSTTVTCPGVQLGDMCDGVSSALDPGAGVIISCNVSAANTVRIQVFNSTLAGITPPTANYTVLMQPKYISP